MRTPGLSRHARTQPRCRQVFCTGSRAISEIAAEDLVTHAAGSWGCLLRARIWREQPDRIRAVGIAAGLEFVRQPCRESRGTHRVTPLRGFAQAASASARSGAWRRQAEAL